MARTRAPTPAVPDPGPEIRGIAVDSRAVEPGFLFAALPGQATDGRRFIVDALARGAVAVLAPEGTVLPDAAADVALLTDPNPRRRLALLAAGFHDRQPERVAAVTGTNGKTSTADFARQLWMQAGLAAASLGTLGIRAPRFTRKGVLTTPDPVVLHAALAELADRGVVRAALEASSHGLDQFRLDGIDIQIAAFTNLTRDHLDYHQSMAAYRAAKFRLFAEVMAPGGTAVLNADVEEFADLDRLCRARGHRVIAYGLAGRDIRLDRQDLHGDGQSLALTVDGRTWQVELPLAGPFQAMNALAALGIVLADGVAPERAVPALARLEGVPGRMERVASLPGGAAVYVDFAHTPDALTTVLAALRRHTAGRLVCVFGCGGDRDPGKRPEMGAAVARAADRVIVTDDNPRSEDPATIRAPAVAAARALSADVVEIGDRRQAIFAAVAGLAPGDVLVVAGKGHESGQTVGGQTLPFDDGEVARQAVAALDVASLASRP
ncbi:UDP-N-acetylmuramoylalanyl-D-glutamate--2,6-diaminopimelate ligase [Stella humosa]|uniref:UDP-N-acetylmuramoyl-L-alanyl-D-glutamate--2,6-diaminopimelate ligase n=2 Tax=Stella humosa TaxID=94 RepID=A0A3N1KZM5_9PROT|nr:UDP-N-acetylmuramoylalanyl-D-glutamate--2,6-diaminopimelate ligase [Stella humosa]